MNPGLADADASFKGLRLLLVDDHELVREGLRRVLDPASRGWSVQEAGSGEEALQQLGDHTFDMVITDLNMPNMDGIGLIKALRALPECKFIPIVMLTTESQAEKKMEGKEAGATGWIVKPFKPEQLIAVVKKVLG